MSQQEIVALEPSSEVSGESKTSVSEKQVPVSEAIRYRKRAQAAEQELSELKQSHEKQYEEVAQLKEKVESLRETVRERLTASVDTEVCSKTQGAKETRTAGARNLLQNAARQAAGSGSRTDVQEYLRLRRNYV